MGAREASITVQDLLETRGSKDGIFYRFQEKLNMFLLEELHEEIPEDNLTVHLSTKVSVVYALLIMIQGSEISYAIDNI